jgi:long-chain acyl-CoA synthetase
MNKDTLPKLLWAKYQIYGEEKIAFRRKKFGIWNRYSWKDYYENVKYMSLGLSKLGVASGDKIAVIGDNSPEWYWAELAIQAVGAVLVGVFTDCTASEVKYFLENSDSILVFAHDQEQVDKVLEIAGDLPLLGKVVYWETKGLWFYEDERLLFIDDLIGIGREVEREKSKSFKEMIEKRNGDEIAFILYTSGSTGMPKGAMLTHRSYIDGVKAFNSEIPYYEDDEYVSFVPPAWAAEQVNLISQLMTGITVNFCESPETVRRDVREVAPHLITYAPRQWEGLCAEIQAKMSDAVGLKSWIYKWVMSWGYGAHQMKGSAIFRRLVYWVANLLLYHGIKDELGLTRARIAITGGSLMGPDIIGFFSAMGIDLRQVYGSTEFPLIAAHRSEDIRNDTVGPPLPHWEEIKIDDDGQILVKGNSIFVGYYKRPEAMAEVVKDGWGCTGDAGIIDEAGHLITHGRLQDFRELMGGELFSPDYIETRLRFSPYIKDCMAIGGPDREYVCAVITIDHANVGNWIEARGQDYTTYADLSQKDSVYGLIKTEIEKINRALSKWSKVMRYALLPKELDPDEAELTRTGKLRRKHMENRYTDIIDALYSGQANYQMETEVAYRDGRKGVMKTDIRIEEL